MRSAWPGLRSLKDGRVALTYFGDGATSEGDFHEAMNFAAVFETPCVFFCQNNGWAISLPRESQTPRRRSPRRHRLRDAGGSR